MKIALLGDAALFGKYSTKNKNIFKYFSEVKEKLKKYDHVILNLETPFNCNFKPNAHKSVYISSEIENVKILKFLGVDIVNLANNHIMDFGKKSFDLTKKVLTENKIDFFGVEGKKILLKNNKTKIELNGFCCYSTNPLGVGRNGINELDYKIVEDILKKNTLNGINNIFSVHAGQEHINYPNIDHIKFARKLSKLGPYVYYGHHPHVLQGVEFVNSSLIAHSLGNFCFDDIFKNDKVVVKQKLNNKSSIILELNYKNNRLLDYNTIPVFSGDHKMLLGNNNTLNKLVEYSSALTLNEVDYDLMRKKLLSLILEERKKTRDWKWYFSRINLRTFYVIKDLFVNRKKYKKIFKKHI
jgi:poly-gamma-glutamate synthesis protein (capsule biosynthesis protein)